MNRAIDTQLVIRLAQVVVEQIVPDEFGLFSSISEAYAKDPERILKKQGESDGLSLSPLEAATLAYLTPTIFLILTQIIVQISSDTTENVAVALFRKIFKRRSSNRQKNKQVPRTFSSEELQNIHQTIIKVAHENKFPEAKGKQFADIVAGQLVIGQSLEEKSS
jgi:hypothetical protein